jgi:hypothetical protein
MLWWIVGTWFGLSLACAGVFHRLRSTRRPVPIPAAVREFLRAFQAALGRQTVAPMELRGMTAGRFVAVLGIGGQEVLLPLHPLYEQFRTDPTSLPGQLDAVLRARLAVDLTRLDEHAAADFAAAVLPQVRSEAWVRAQAPLFGDAALVTRRLNADLRVCYVIDAPASMVFVTRAHLRAWGVDDAALHQAACTNLRQRGGAELPTPADGAPPILLQVGDGYDAARVLLLDPERAEGLFVALPERDALWIGKPEAVDLAHLMQVNRAQSEASSYPVSVSMYRMTEGELVPVSEPSAG